MNLRNRALLILGSLFFVFFVVIAVVSLNVTLSGLDRLEYQEIHEAVLQTQAALTSENQALLSTTQDWAWWDDMAQYAQGTNAGFIDRNANPANLATVKVHLFIILDEKGQVLHSILLSPDFSTNTSAPEDILGPIRTTPGMIGHTATDPGTAGLLQFPEGPMILASTPILLSDKSGPARGTVIMGRYLDYGPHQKISSITSYQFGLHWPATEGGEDPIGSIRDQLAHEPLVLVPANASMVTAYSTLEDLAGGHPVISVSVPRDLYETGLANITTYILLLAFWAVLTGVIVVIVMDRVVLRRIELLAGHVRTVSAGPDPTLSPVLSGNDELASLEQTILSSRRDLVVRERQLRAFINAMPDPAGLYTRNGTILLANTALAAYLHKSPAELAGTPIRDHLPPEEYEQYRRQANEAIRKKAAVQYEAEGGGKTYLLSHYPVLDAKGEVVQIGLLTFDISERKRLENALQKVTRKVALLNTVIFSDIQNRVFVQRGYQELLRKITTDPQVRDYLEKEEHAVKEIQASVQFAKQYNDMGANPPRWQKVHEVFLFAISHLDPGNLQRDFRLEGLEIYADPLLERVFFNLIENVLRHGDGATVIRAGYAMVDTGLVITFEDNGRGIPTGEKERIFAKGKGTSGAVGLFLSREILSITGITIHETGEPGKGARFEILVPRGVFRIYGK
jgi:PAS domain S-box-containing protein